MSARRHLTKSARLSTMRLGADGTDDLAAEGGSGRCRGRAEVLPWSDEAPLVEYPAVGEGAPVTETGEVKRPDVHHCLEPVELVVGGLDVPAVGSRLGAEA